MDFNINIEQLKKAYLDDAFWEVVTQTNPKNIPSIAHKVAADYGVDVTLLANQIESYHKLLKKHPNLCVRGVLLPPPLNLSQSSSEVTANFKAKLVAQYEPKTIIDCTGGFGIDSFSLAKTCAELLYCEKNENLATIVKENVKQLGVKNIRFYKTYTQPTISDKVFWYADPSRRDDEGKRVFSLDQFSPNPTDLLNHFLGFPGLLKLPPMLDISLLVKLFAKGLKNVYAVSHKNDCKELLLEFDPNYSGKANIKAVVLTNKHELSFSTQELKTFSEACTLESLHEGAHIFVPDVALVKANLVDEYAADMRFSSVENSGLYHMDKTAELVMGKKLELIDVVPFKQLPKALKTYERINVAVGKGFPLKANQVEAKLGLIPGGDYFLYAIRNVKGKSFGLILKWLNK